MSVSPHSLVQPVPSRVVSTPSTTGWARPVRWRITGNARLARELVRQTWHMLPGLIPFLFWFHPHTDPLSDAFRWISLGVAVTVSLIVFVRIQAVLRPSEGRGGEAVLGYALCVLGTLWMFPEHGELGMTVLAVLAFGDGMGNGITAGSQEHHQQCEKGQRVASGQNRQAERTP